VRRAPCALCRWSSHSAGYPAPAKATASGLAHGSGTSWRLLHRWRSRHAVLPLERIRHRAAHGGASRRPPDHGAGSAARGQRDILLRFDNVARGAPCGFLRLRPASGSGCGSASIAKKAISHGAERPRQAHFCPSKRGVAHAGPWPESGLSPAAKRATRLVAGLPEGYFEVFGTLYRDYADILVARRAGATPDPLALWAPTAEDGVCGMAFVEAALASNADGAR
jgi:hypothetical protein